MVKYTTLSGPLVSEPSKWHPPILKNFHTSTVILNIFGNMFNLQTVTLTIMTSHGVRSTFHRTVIPLTLMFQVTHLASSVCATAARKY